jgi:hypothetical protein
VVNDLDVNLTEEVLEQLALEDALASEFCSLSINAIAVTDQGEALKLKALLKNKAMLILVDSGSSHSVVSKAFLSRVGIQEQPMKPQVVKVANGESLICDSYVPQMEWWCQGYTFTIDMKVLGLGAFDAILGFDWLKPHSPMSCHWDSRTLTFEDQGKEICLQGVLPPPLQLLELSADTLVKWCAGNDIGAFAIIEPVLDNEQQANCPEVQQLLLEFQDVFEDPKTLPPERPWDHSIPLLPNSVPVSARPYRYSPLHKDEIERQVKALLAAGLITPSTSPFASPVLLVQKKDGSWRFCIDYRRLNDITVKNRFPMPIIDEILDELAGTRYFTKLDMRSGYHQVCMKKEDEHKTAFKTHHGHYQFKVMPFGLTNAPATFQCIMNIVLEPFLRKFVLVFLDDILIYIAQI